jgi:hypothetical protein
MKVVLRVDAADDHHDGRERNVTVGLHLCGSKPKSATGAHCIANGPVGIIGLLEKILVVAYEHICKFECALGSERKKLDLSGSN